MPQTTGDYVLYAFFVFAECAEHFKVAISQGVGDPFL
jgi:hypothetical protein